jgi:hypothetical protein
VPGSFEVVVVVGAGAAFCAVVADAAAWTSIAEISLTTDIVVFGVFVDVVALVEGVPAFVALVFVFGVVTDDDVAVEVVFVVVFEFALFESVVSVEPVESPPC